MPKPSNNLADCSARQKNGARTQPHRRQKTPASKVPDVVVRRAPIEPMRELTVGNQTHYCSVSRSG